MTHLMSGMEQEHPVRRAAWAIGVVLLIFGNFLPGGHHHHWPILGLALIVLSVLF
jgi:hypothetical protein